KVENVRTSVLPPIRNVLKEIPGRHGALHNRVILGPRLIEVDIRLIENTRKEVKQVARKMAGLLYKKEPKKLIFKEEPKKDELAILDVNTDLERLFFTGFTTLVFLCPEPATYGEKYIVDIGGTMHNMGTYPSKG